MKASKFSLYLKPKEFIGFAKLIYCRIRWIDINGYRKIAN